MKAAALAIAIVGCLLAAGACRAQTSAAGPGPSPRARRIHADVQAILSSPPYQVRKADAPFLARLGRQISEALERALGWLGRLLRKFRPIDGLGGATALLPRIIAATLVTAMVIGLAWAAVAIIRRLGKRERRARKRKALVEQAAVEPDDPGTVPPDTWLEAARKHAADGDFRRAYRAVFLAILLRLDRAGALVFHRSRTNGEYLRALRERPDLLGCVRPVALGFDARWYGQQPIGRAEYESITDGYRQVVARLEPAGEPD